MRPRPRAALGGVLFLAAALLTSVPGSATGEEPSADVPAPRTDENSQAAHRELLEKRTKGRIDVYFVGDSITRRWGATDYPHLLENWRSNFHGWNAANFAWGADRIENILWRLEHGELDEVHPKVIVIQAGANNVAPPPGGDARIDNVTRGIAALIDACRRKAPDAAIVLTAIFLRNDDMTVVPEIYRINERLARLAGEKGVRFLDINDRLADGSGRLRRGVMNDDGLHPSAGGYQIWADALKPLLTELLGPPAAEDLAPPATGDPSARKGATP